MENLGLLLDGNETIVIDGGMGKFKVLRTGEDEEIQTAAYNFGNISDTFNETSLGLEARTPLSDYWEVPDLRRWIPMELKFVLLSIIPTFFLGGGSILFKEIHKC